LLAKHPREARPSRAQTRQLLLKDVAEGKWRAWVQNERGNATEAELAMARGPRLTCTMWNAMDYQAVTFLTQGGQPAGKKSNECLVLTWHTVHEPSGQRVKYPYVGKLKSFLTNVPPWALGNYEERQSQAVKLVYAEWFDYVGRNTNALQLPIFKKSTPSDPNGNLWDADKIVPTSVGAAQYDGIEHANKQNLLQIIVRDAAVFKDLVPDPAVRPG